MELSGNHLATRRHVWLCLQGRRPSCCWLQERDRHVCLRLVPLPSSLSLKWIVALLPQSCFPLYWTEFYRTAIMLPNWFIETNEANSFLPHNILYPTLYILYSTFTFTLKNIVYKMFFFVTCTFSAICSHLQMFVKPQSVRICGNQMFVSRGLSELHILAHTIWINPNDQIVPDK